MANITRQGIALIQQFEGLELCPYKDPAGHWTIGWGHLLKEDELAAYVDPTDQDRKTCISREQALALLAADVKVAMEAVERQVDVPLNDNQFSALVSFVFNLGEENFSGSTLKELINLLDFHAAGNEFQKWSKHRQDGKLVRSIGLFARRRAEELLWNTPPVVYNPQLVAWAGEYDNRETASRGRVPGAVTIVVYPDLQEGVNGKAAEVVETDGEREG